MHRSLQACALCLMAAALVAAALGAADMKEFFEANSVIPLGGTPEDLGEALRSGIDAYATVVKLANLKPE